MAKKLSDSDIQIIIALWSSGKGIKKIAELLNEQENTIKYHLNKLNIDITDEPYEILGKSYDEYREEDDDRIRRKQGKCCHPSFKCSICHMMKDNVCSDNYQTIQRQNRYIVYLETELRRNFILFNVEKFDN